MTKKTLFLSVLGCMALSFAYFLVGRSEACNDWMFCRNLTDSVAVQIILIACGTFWFFALPVSLVLLFFREEIFKSWWRFSKWLLLAAVILTLALSIKINGGTIGIGTDFSLFPIFASYFLFILISIIMIVRAWFRISKAIKAK